MDAIDRFGEALVEAGARPRKGRRLLRPTARRTSVLGRSRLHIALVALALVFATTAIALAATGVILTGSPVQPCQPSDRDRRRGDTGPRRKPAAAPASRRSRWGATVGHADHRIRPAVSSASRSGASTTAGSASSASTDAFADDGRFHPLPADALPDVLGGSQGWLSGKCAAPRRNLRRGHRRTPAQRRQQPPDRPE